jgi:hypothetical protein
MRLPDGVSDPPFHCPKGHRVIFGTGECWTVDEQGQYIYGDCEDLPANQMWATPEAAQ